MDGMGPGYEGTRESRVISHSQVADSSFTEMERARKGRHVEKKIKHIKDTYGKNYKMLMKEDLNK